MIAIEFYSPRNLNGRLIIVTYFKNLLLVIILGLVVSTSSLAEDSVKDICTQEADEIGFEDAQERSDYIADCIGSLDDESEDDSGDDEDEGDDESEISES